MLDGQETPRLKLNTGRNAILLSQSIGFFFLIYIYHMFIY